MTTQNAIKLLTFLQGVQYDYMHYEFIDPDAPTNTKAMAERNVEDAKRMRDIILSECSTETLEAVTRYFKNEEDLSTEQGDTIELEQGGQLLSERVLGKPSLANLGR